MGPVPAEAELRENRAKAALNQVDFRCANGKTGHESGSVSREMLQKFRCSSGHHLTGLGKEGLVSVVQQLRSKYSYCNALETIHYGASSVSNRKGQA